MKKFGIHYYEDDDIDTNEDMQFRDDVTDAFEENYPPFNLFMNDLSIGDAILGPKNIQYIHYHNKGVYLENPTKIAFCLSEDEKTVEMNSMSGGIFVCPEFRGEGHGRQLINAMEAVGRNRKATALIIHGVTAPGFWEKVGYIHHERQTYIKLLEG